MRTPEDAHATLSTVVITWSACRMRAAARSLNRPARLLRTEDRVSPAALMRRLVPERLGVQPVELTSGHHAALSRPAELALAVENRQRHR